MNGWLLDTCTWIWVQHEEKAKLSAAFLQEIEDQQRKGTAYVSAVSVLEIARLVHFGNFDLRASIESFIAEATIDGGLRLLELSPRVLIESIRLPGVIHRDPSDRMLVATARVHGLTLVTRDKKLLAYAKQGHLNARKP